MLIRFTLGAIACLGVSIGSALVAKDTLSVPAPLAFFVGWSFAFLICACAFKYLLTD